MQNMEQKHMERGPIFIGGTGRSGKTWMRFMLSSHPNICLSRRANLWTDHDGRYGDLARVANLERCLDTLLRSKHIQFLNPDADRIRREFRHGPATYARLFALLHEHYAEQQGKPRWGDQTEMIEALADRILAAYPPAKFIHMLRDPRDCAAAMMERRGRGKGGIGAVAAAWVHSARLAQRNMQRYPDSYMTVQYETLVRQPEQTLRQVCVFLSEDYEPAMLAMDDIPRFRQSTAPGQSPLSAAFIGGFRNALSRRQVAFIQRYAAAEMLAFGYASELLKMNEIERFAFWMADWPANLLRAAAWRRLAAGLHATG